MKNFVILCFSLTVVCFSAFANVVEDLHVINVCNLTEPDLKEIMEGNRPEIALEFPAQTQIPIGLFLKGDFIHLLDEKEFGMLEIKQAFYVKCVEGELMFSSNLKEWDSFLEFQTGTLSIRLNVKDGVPSLMIGAETNFKNP